MHHHHPPLPLPTTSSIITSTATAVAIATSTNATISNNTISTASAPQQQQRRRKKRPNHGTRTVEVRRGCNGFGFTISGQQPCRLSCIITNSPAEHSGLRDGDFLISVNGLNVSKLPHETVAQILGSSFGSIRMQIAQNYYSDSSDEENANATLLLQQQQSLHGAGVGLLACAAAGIRTKPRFLHHKTKMHRLRNSPQKKRSEQRIEAAMKPTIDAQTLRPLIEELPTVSTAKPKPTPLSTVVSADVANVSAMVRVVPSAALEYRAIVGYLGTIEMPKQISHSSKLQTVRSCIRKLRQEKRQPTNVLMSILPECLRLHSANGNLLASYASARLNYVSSSSESENRFFGLVTSAVHTTQIDEEFELETPPDDKSTTGHISISHSCHVFVIDTKQIEHQHHIQRACEFRIQCTRDPISNLCLEFPNNSEYVVNLIRSMYTMRILPPATRSTNHEYDAAAVVPAVGAVGMAAAHSPQPSNHSEISTTTSNSDSGIGFNNDCTNVSDRIVVVDFPGAIPAAPLGQAHSTLHSIQRNIRPLGICFDAISSDRNRLTVRAMPDPRSPNGRPDLLANFNLLKSPATCLTATRSCDDVLELIERTPTSSSECAMTNGDYLMPSHASMDDISLHSAVTATAEEAHLFLHPSALFMDCLAAARSRKPRHSLQPTSIMTTTTTTSSTTPHKLSPQVFGSVANATPKYHRHSLGFEAIDAATTPHTSLTHMTPSTVLSYDLDMWSSLQNIHANIKTESQLKTETCQLEATSSEPDLCNRELPANASSFRRAWGQSSFRTPRIDKLSDSNSHNNNIRSPLVRRTASMTASDNDVYIKSMDSSGGCGYIDELKQSRSQQQLGSSSIVVPQIRTEPPPKTTTAQTTTIAAEEMTGPSGVAAWGTSFERMLQDPAGMQTFAEFLKKEFSAENIYFWTACERFRLLESDAERVTQAREIFIKHLSNAGTDPVNVDSQARNLTEEKLQTAASDIFAPAQKQIFNLMKFDSYQRFIRSDLFKSCVEAEERRQPLPFSGDDLDELLKTNFHQPASASKLKKSASNAEDRRRKSLLPWHRKTRSKSRDRNELTASSTSENAITTNNQILNGNKMNMLMPAPPPPPPSTASKLNTLSSSSLKLAATSINDLHSSRSSLSSFDANNGVAEAATACSLCRVILSDGATTIVQIRADETVGQLVERLLEKRGLTYQYYDVVPADSTKSIDLQSSSQTISGKEVTIEQRVAFKLDLPDPKVISVKSKPKKQLHEVIRPILHKYNYSMTGVQVLLRDTHERLDLSLPVTVANGQRLQIVLLQPQHQQTQDRQQQDFQQGGGTSLPPKFAKPTPTTSFTPTTAKMENIFPPNLAKRAAGIAVLRNGGIAIANSSGVNAGGSIPSQSMLDEITNKVFNEVLQGKVEAHAATDQNTKQKPSDLSSLKSDDCASETSSIFDRMRRRDSNTPSASKPIKSKKKSTSSQHSEDTTSMQFVDPKKPIIAKLKAGVKLQVTERVAETQDELLEGLKRAQLARLEDQRGTEINFELPDFLKNKENLNAAASKLRKMRANLSPITKPMTTHTTSLTTTLEQKSQPNTPTTEPPQPAPRLSITLQKQKSVSPMKIDEHDADVAAADISSTADFAAATKGPPPLPPKPKVLPIKPSNWGASTNSNPTCSNMRDTSSLPTNKIPIDIEQTSTLLAAERLAYLDQPASSFV